MSHVVIVHEVGEPPWAIGEYPSHEAARAAVADLRQVNGIGEDEILATELQRPEQAREMYYDRELDEQCGYHDALAGKPRASTRFGYRTGYDRGLSEVCKRVSQERKHDGRDAGEVAEAAMREHVRAVTEALRSDEFGGDFNESLSLATRLEQMLPGYIALRARR